VHYPGFFLGIYWEEEAVAAVVLGEVDLVEAAVVLEASAEVAAAAAGLAGDGKWLENNKTKLMDRHKFDGFDLLHRFDLIELFNCELNNTII
jgi:hypothetical protein